MFRLHFRKLRIFFRELLRHLSKWERSSWLVVVVAVSEHWAEPQVVQEHLNSSFGLRHSNSKREISQWGGWILVTGQVSLINEVCVSCGLTVFVIIYNHYSTQYICVSASTLYFLFYYLYWCLFFKYFILFSWVISHNQLLHVELLNLVSVMFQVMWVCNVCRRKQEILTRSGEFHSNMTTTIPQPPMQGSPGATGPLSNGATERSVWILTFCSTGSRDPGTFWFFIKKATDSDSSFVLKNIWKYISDCDDVFSWVWLHMELCQKTFSAPLKSYRQLISLVCC